MNLKDKIKPAFEVSWGMSLILSMFGLIGLVSHVYDTPVTNGPYQAIIGTLIGYISTKFFWFFLIYGITGIVITNLLSKRKGKQ